MKGWHKESYRHYLASKGIKTKKYMKTKPHHKFVAPVGTSLKGKSKKELEGNYADLDVVEDKWKPEFRERVKGASDEQLHEVVSDKNAPFWEAEEAHQELLKRRRK